MIKYRTTDGSASIEEVEVIRETGQMVFFPSEIGRVLRGERKKTAYTQYHNTLEDARDWLLDKANYDLDLARKRLGDAHSFKLQVLGIEVEGDRFKEPWRYDGYYNWQDKEKING